MSTFHYIKQNDFDEMLVIAEMLAVDTNNLIHKAVGWMLREVGKRDLSKELVFLMKHHRITTALQSGSWMGTHHLERLKTRSPA